MSAQPPTSEEKSSSTSAAPATSSTAADSRGAAAVGKQALRSVEKIPFCSINASPRSKQWEERLKEEYRALIAYVTQNKNIQREWFKLEANSDGTQWKGRCWFVHDLVTHELQLEIDIHPTYPLTPPDLRLPELEGKTSKMYRGGRICLDVHFAPLWQKNAPRFGVAHSLALGLAPWLAAEIPALAENGVL